MKRILTELADKVAPARTALLVIDMQNDFCAEGGYIHKTMGGDVSGSKAVAARIQTLVEAARTAGAMPVWIRAIYDPKYLAPPVLAKQQQNGVAGIVCCGEGTWGADYFAIAPAPGDFEVIKHRYSAFSCTELDNILRDHRIETLVCTGVATNVCVESTLRDGFMNGYYIVVPSDCVAGQKPQLHEATLANVRALLGDVTDSATLIDLWSRSARQAAE